MKKIKNLEIRGVKLEIFNFESRRFCQNEIGRSDINGISIKEGDVIAVFGSIGHGGVVVYNDTGCGFCFEHEKMYESAFAHGWGESQESFPEDSWEVVGSIYEN